MVCKTKQDLMKLRQEKAALKTQTQIVPANLACECQESGSGTGIGGATGKAASTKKGKNIERRKPAMGNAPLNGPYV